MRLGDDLRFHILCNVLGKPHIYHQLSKNGLDSREYYAPLAGLSTCRDRRAPLGRHQARSISRRSPVTISASRVEIGVQVSWDSRPDA